MIPVLGPGIVARHRLWGDLVRLLLELPGGFIYALEDGTTWFSPHNMIALERKDVAPARRRGARKKRNMTTKKKITKKPTTKTVRKGAPLLAKKNAKKVTKK